MAWKNVLGDRREIILTTSSKNGQPNAIIAMSLGPVNDKLLVANCLMKSTLENIRSNPSVCVVGIGEKEYYRLRGIASEFFAGDFFDAAVKKSSPTPPVKSAIVIDIKEIFDLDKGEKIL
jgi:flavin reductase (DIM6/NTAB) family NADH-FMN oxidoreductase RutF